MNRKLACLTLDMEPDYADPQGHIRLLEKPEYFERYTGILQKHKAKLTMFTVTSLFERFGEDFKRLEQRIPLEYAAHSYSHDPHNAVSRDEVEKSMQSLERVNGSGPLGYRAPIGQITKDGLNHLLDFGFDYDASLYPSIRPGRFGYWNLDKPNVPFQVTRQGGSLLEFPFTSLSGVRIVFGLSYVKLLGWRVYSMLWRIFGLPYIALVLSHPHDFYFHELAQFHPMGLERIALTRNAERAFDYYDRMLGELSLQGYEFAFVSDAYRYAKDKPEMKRIALENWK